MKNLFKNSTFIIALLISNFAFAQNFEVTNNDLLAMANKTMQGELTYLNYSDDSSTATLKCKISTFVEKSRLQTRIIFEEKDKNGKPYKQSSSIKLSKDGGTFYMGRDAWQVLKSTKDEGTINLTVYKKGEDNNREADMQMVVELDESGKISWGKQVRYKGTDKLFQRNQYTFSK